MSERLIELRVENKRLKEQIINLEDKIMALVGMVNIESSGDADRKNVLNDLLINLINSTKEQLNIVTPKFDSFYVNELKNLVKREIPVLVITTDRGAYSKKEVIIYDDLKNTQGISVINKPKIKLLLAFNTEQAVYSGGFLDKEELSKSILVVTTVKEKSKLRLIAEIFTSMLPTFMRK
ncbi:hypothetical protein LCGC14_0830630 [marine sediment metagenome]|uniref:Uncharacterized protein n=1 Tax=marine sediment metagenome TaxID=412755 RepID=A0A0F9SNB8_9ZZZZ